MHKDIKLQIHDHKISRIAAYMILLVVSLAIIGSITALIANKDFLWQSPQSFIATLSSYLSSGITIGGGYLIGYLLLREIKASRVHRVVAAGTVGLIATILYSLLFRVVTRFFTAPGTGAYTLLIPLVLALIGVALMCLIARRGDHTFLSKTLRYTFFVSFWLYQAIEAGQIFYFYIVRPAGTTFDPYPLWLTIPSLLLTPLITALIFLAAIRASTVKYKVYYVSLFAALVYYFLLEVWQFEISPIAQAVDAFFMFVTIIGILLLIVLTVAISRSSRTLSGKHNQITKYLH